MSGNRGHRGLVGVDTGGALAQLLMAYHRDRVGRVVLTGCDAYEDFPPARFRFVLAPLRTASGTWLLAQAARGQAVRRIGVSVSRLLTHAAMPDALVARWVSPLRTLRSAVICGKW